MMLTKVFDYNNLIRFKLECDPDLSARISNNLEPCISTNSQSPDCSIKINQAHPPIKIIKDKRLAYLTVTKSQVEHREVVNYRRYGTDVRTINSLDRCNYIVNTNTELDEESGLICIKNHLRNNQVVSDKPYVFASLVEVDGRGILIAGPKRYGKTTFMTYLLQEQKANLVSDDKLILDSYEGKALGLYVPGSIRVRFSTISDSNLAVALDNLPITDATQYLDPDAITKIIATKSYYVDEGLVFSRKSFCEILKVNSTERCFIDTVIFQRYAPRDKAKLKRLDTDEGRYRLNNIGLYQEKYLGADLMYNTHVNLDEKMYKIKEFFELSYSCMSDLFKQSLRL